MLAADAARISRLDYSPQAGTTRGRGAGRIGRTGSSGSRRASADAVALMLIITELPSRPDYNGPVLRVRVVKLAAPDLAHLAARARTGGRESRRAKLTDVVRSDLAQVRRRPKR